MTPRRPRSRSAAARIGLFGGTFDPPHLGHLVIAEWARSQLDLERVVFMPSGTPPHKRGRVITPVAHRVAMTRLAVRGNPSFEVSTLESRRPGASYTIDTLLTLNRRWPGARFFLVIGEDSLNEFHTWYEPEAILALATLVVAPRPGAAPASQRSQTAPARLPPAKWIDSPPFAVASSEIRRRVRTGGSIRYLVTEPVLTYIDHHHLYRDPARRR